MIIYREDNFLQKDYCNHLINIFKHKYVERIHKIENKVHHDLIAFLTSITEKVGKSGL